MFTDGTSSKEPMRMKMPAWFKAAMNETYGHDDVSNDKPAAGTPARSGDEVRVIFAKHALSAGINLDQIDSETRYDPQGHCGRNGCDCTHTKGCYKGWIDEKPCRNCRPQLHFDIMNGKVTLEYT